MSKPTKTPPPPASPHADAALVLQPPPWGDGPIGTDFDEDLQGETMRGRLTALINASEGSAAAELRAWLRPVGTPSWSFAGWLALWALQRPTFLQAVAMGYGAPGHVVMSAVRDMTGEVGSVPTVTYMRTRDGQVVVQFEWAGYEPMIFLRAPVIRSEACVSLAISPDAWQQLDAEELLARAAPDDDVATEVARLAPGRLDPGEVQPPGNLDLARAFFWLQLTDEERTELRKALPPYPTWEHKKADAQYVDRKRQVDADQVEAPKPDPQAAARATSSARPTTSSDASPASTSSQGATSSPDSGSSACAAGSVVADPRVAVIAKRRQHTHFLETIVHPPAFPQGRADLVLWREAPCPTTSAPMSVGGPPQRVEAVVNDDVLWARANLKRMGSVPHEGAIDGTCATCARSAGEPVSLTCLVCLSDAPPVFRGRCLACQEKVEVGDLKGLAAPTEKDARAVYFARMDARSQAKACAANPEARDELHRQVNAALLRPAQPTTEVEVPEAVVPDAPIDEPLEDAVCASERERETTAPTEADRDDEGFPLVSVFSCPCGHNQFMPTSEAKRLAPLGCPTCHRDAASVTVVETGSGKRWTGTDLARAAKDPDPGAGPPTPPAREQASTPDAVLEEINPQKATKDLEPSLAFRSSAGGRCEWNPMKGTLATIKQPGCTERATVMVGAKSPWKLCARCAGLPCFRRKSQAGIK
jgi:hypothetical protein